MTQTVTERPRLLVVAGPNGAGKTTITEEGLAHEWFGGCEYVNPDLLAQQEFGDWNDPNAVLAAARLATERREACLRDGRSLAFETVFSSSDKSDFVRRAIAAGFFVRLFFVGTSSYAALGPARRPRPISSAFDRLLLGYVLLPNEGGRLVCPVPFVREAILRDRKLEDRLEDDLDDYKLAQKLALQKRGA